MDDMKKTLYIDILNKLAATDGRAHICIQITCILVDVFGITSDKSQTSLVDLITEFFPEFMALYDGYRYAREGRDKQDISGSWFAHDSRHARISLINFLLTHR